MNTVDPAISSDGKIPRNHETQLRVRFQETDAQGRAHHANYINYFEIGRVEMLRASGRTYRELEESGVMLVVTDVQCKYFLPAVYDDLLTIKTTVTRSKGVRVQHHYQIVRGDELLVEGETTVACVDRTGKVTRLPEWLRLD